MAYFAVLVVALIEASFIQYSTSVCPMPTSGGGNITCQPESFTYEGIFAANDGVECTPFDCPQGTNSTGSATCVNGEWDPQQPMCIADSEGDGDPHVTRLGTSKKLLITGSCWHILSSDMDCPGYGDKVFRITGNFRRGLASAALTYIHEVDVSFRMLNNKVMTAALQQGPKVILSIEGKQKSQEIITFPFSDDKDFPEIDLDMDNDRILELKLPNGIYLRWDGRNDIDIKVDPEKAGPVCGLFGQDTGNSEDMIVGPHDVTKANDPVCPKKAASQKFGSVTKDVRQYGDSWFYARDDSDPSCVNECLQ